MQCPAVYKKTIFRGVQSVLSSCSPSQRFAFTDSSTNHRTDETVATKKILIDFGFSDHESEKILLSCSSRGPLQSQPLLQTVNFWSSLQLAPRHVTSMLADNTDLLYVTQEQGIKMYQFLAENFTKSQVKNIFLNAPRIVHRNSRLIEEIIKFLELDKKVAREELVSSGALVHSLSHIRSRIEFLERAGLFTVPKKKGVTVDNPGLDWILNTSDKKFATQVAGLSTDEYEVFRELLGKDDEFSSDFDEF